MPNSEFSNLDFGFRYGTLAEINNTSILDGTFNIDIENGNLYVDITSRRIPLTDIIFGYKEAEIKAMAVPDSKIYFAKDTFNMLYFDFNDISWKTVGGENATKSQFAVKDELGNVINTTYETISNVASISEGLQDQINTLDDKVEAINKFDIQFYDNIEDLPEEGTKFVFYMVPSTSDNEDGSDKTDNLYAVYLWIVSEGVGYYEQVGLTTLDLKNYYTKSEVEGFIGDLDTTCSNTYETKTDATSKKEEVEAALDEFKEEVARVYQTKASAASDDGSTSAALDLYKDEVAETYATQTALSDVLDDVSDFKTQAIKSVTISGNDLTVTPVTGEAVVINISTVIKTMVGLTTETIGGVSYDVMDYGAEDNKS